MRIAFLAVWAAVLVVGRAVAQSPAPDARVQRAEADLAAARNLAATVTNAAEQAIWARRVELSEKELANVRRRIELEAREKELQSRRSERQAHDQLLGLLRAVDPDTTEIESQAVELNKTIRRLQALREDVATRLGRIAETQTEDRVEYEQRIVNIDAETRARVLERDGGDLRVRLAREAQRIEKYVREQELTPRPTIRRIIELRRQRDTADKGREEARALAAMVEEQHASVQEALTLNEERLGHLNEEIRTLENLHQLVRPALFASQKETPEQAERRRQVWQMLTEARSQVRWLQERVKHRAAQLAALQQSQTVTRRLQELANAEHDFLHETFDASLRRLGQRVAIPLGAVLVLLVLSLILRQLVLPWTLRAENLHVARRAVSYTSGLLIIAILAVFFLEDLKAIATILGIAGAAVVIALQDLCSGFAGWFAIIASGKIQVGDRVEIDGHRGDVVDIQLLRTTLLEVGNWMGSDESTGRTIIIPNNFIFKSQVFNYSHGHPYIWGKVDLTLTFESPAREAQSLLEHILREETRAEFEAARQASVGIRQRYGVEDAVYEPRVIAALGANGVHYSLFYVSHYRKDDELRHRLATRILGELEKDPRFRVAYATQRELHEPNPVSYQTGQHGKLADD